MYIQSETQIEVRYYETDLMGIVHHSNYIRYFECGRHQFLLDVGLPITELEKSGIMMPVVSVEAHYHTPARMGDILRVVSRVEKEPMARVEVRTDIYNQNGDLVCDGTVVLGFIHSDTRRPTRIPPIRKPARKRRQTVRQGCLTAVSRKFGKCRLICISLIFRCLQIGLHFSPLCETPKNALDFASVL